MDAVDMFNLEAGKDRDKPELQPYVTGRNDPSAKWPFWYMRKPETGHNGITITAKFKTAEEANYFATRVNRMYD